jgi:hypothetical protein
MGAVFFATFGPRAATDTHTSDIKGGLLLSQILPLAHLVLIPRVFMKAYLITTGTPFGLIALAHLLRTVCERSRLATDPWFILERPGLGVAAGAAGWHWPSAISMRCASGFASVLLGHHETVAVWVSL